MTASGVPQNFCGTIPKDKKATKQDRAVIVESVLYQICQELDKSRGHGVYCLHMMTCLAHSAHATGETLVSDRRSYDADFIGYICGQYCIAVLQY